ncbi:MAG: hypothetical protein KDA44_13955 [Planctomycetales bacterium]|nr:hypothetical protein [Planctomycetales bacterium]
MDSAEYPSLLALMRAHSQLASDARRIERVVDGYLADGRFDHVERLFRAATVDDWQAISLAARQLAQPVAEEPAPEVAAAARELVRTIRRNRPTRRSAVLLGELLQACRTLQERRRAAS